MGELLPYRKTAIQMMRPYIEGEQLPDKVSISEADRLNGSPKVGDMIAVNPQSPDDMWLVAEKFFKDNYEPANTRPQAEGLKDAMIEVLAEKATSPECPTCGGNGLYDDGVCHDCNGMGMWTAGFWKEWAKSEALKRLEVQDG